MGESMKGIHGIPITQNGDLNESSKVWTAMKIINSENGSAAEEVEFFPRLFQNDMLLSKILSYLTPQDLFGCRLLCKVWNSEASKILGKKIILTLDFRYPDYLPSSPVFQGMSQVGEKLAILLPEFTNTNRQNPEEKWKPWIRKPKIHPKMLAQLTEIISLPTNHFSSLTLNMTVSSSGDFSILTLILEKLSQTLKILVLDIHFHYDLEQETLPSFTLPCLTTFSHFSPKCADSDDDDCIFTDKAWNWLSFFTSLFTEKVGKFCFNRNHFQLYYQHFLKMGTSPKMKELSLREVSSLHFRPFLPLEIPLVSLELFDLDIAAENEIDQEVQKLLQKVSGTLERLIFSFGWSKDVLEVNVVEGFPKLKELSLSYGTWVEKIQWQSLDGRVIDYFHLFPVLSSLEVMPPKDFSKENRWFNGRWNFRGVFDAFFPENSTQVCKTVRKLKVPMLTEEEGLSGDYSLYRERLRTIAKMFPNACNPGWKEWRDFS